MLLFKTIYCTPKLLAISIGLLLLSTDINQKDDFAVLVFSKTEGYRHESIPEGVQMLKELGSTHHFSVDHTEEASAFTDQNLANYNVVLFLSTTGDVLNEAQQGAFERFFSQNHGFVGIHSAADTEYDWDWYSELIGAQFKDHPPGTPTATIRKSTVSHTSTAHLPGLWIREDEWYNYTKHPDSDIQVLATVDESTYQGGSMGQNHPIIWCHEYEGGRAWYTGCGHTVESYQDENFKKHILGGIYYAAGIKNSDL